MAEIEKPANERVEGQALEPSAANPLERAATTTPQDNALIRSMRNTEVPNGFPSLETAFESPKNAETKLENELNSLADLDRSFSDMDKDNDGRITKKELDAYKPYNESSKENKAYLDKHFAEMANSQPLDHIVMSGLAGKDDPLLAQAQSVIKNELGDYLETASKQALEYGLNRLKSANTRPSYRTEQAEQQEAGAARALAAFDKLATRSDDPERKNGLDTKALKTLDISKIEDPKLAEAVKELQNSYGLDKNNDGSLTKTEIAGLANRFKNDSILKDIAKDKIAKLDYAIANFDKIQGLAPVKGELQPSIDLRTLARDNNDPATKFLSSKGSSIDKDGDGKLTKEELEQFKNTAHKETTEAKAEDQKQAQEREKSIKALSDVIANYDKIKTASQTDTSIGISYKDIQDQRTKVIADGLKEAAAADKPTISKTLESALISDIAGGGARSVKELEQQYNKLLAAHGLEVKIDHRIANGPHGNSVREGKLSLVNQKSGKTLASFDYSYDTLRS